MEKGRTLQWLLCIRAKLTNNQVLELAAPYKRSSPLTIPSLGSMTIFLSSCSGSDEYGVPAKKDGRSLTLRTLTLWYKL